jgi:hypothetical protein
VSEDDKRETGEGGTVGVGVTLREGIEEEVDTEQLTEEDTEE